jgi:hypothetical protein
MILLEADNMIPTMVLSVAEFIQRAVRKALLPHGQGAWMKYAGFVDTGDASSSRTIDEIVYGRRD